ncbi:hypothetical protein OQJ13_10205 [Legionella sp. PATHC035]|uniref:hypothetical protein n=1 Tax=Legionella sp. PATHC035 TaxID=2992040 RepID=UPI0022436248|nr:hypothetical protein [Legionella sp. PATHC035]MCW8409345.1 hypothetical protein [Legionella sp. PATHC035]
MKLIKTNRIYTEKELLDLFETIHRDALRKDADDFTKKYALFEIPEPLIQFDFGNGETILHKLMKAVAELFARKNSVDFFSEKLAQLLYFFEFLMKHGADINSTFKTYNTPLSYLLGSPFLLDIKRSPIFEIIDQYKHTINSETLEIMVMDVLDNKHMNNETKKDLIDKFISWGAEITRELEVAYVNYDLFQENLLEWKHDVLLRKQEKLKEKVTEHERTIEDLKLENRLIKEQLAQLIQKVDSLLNSSETPKTNPETSSASLSFFTN